MGSGLMIPATMKGAIGAINRRKRARAMRATHIGQNLHGRVNQGPSCQLFFRLMGQAPMEI